MSTVELLTLGGELVLGVKLVSTMSDAFTKPEVRGEFMVAEEETLL